MKTGSFPTKSPMDFFGQTAVQFGGQGRRKGSPKFDFFLLVRYSENSSNIFSPAAGGRMKHTKNSERLRRDLKKLPKNPIKKIGSNHSVS